MTWWEHAACKGMDTNLFYPSEHDNKTLRAALDVCAVCPVQEECLQAGLLEEHGVWGGMSINARERLKRGLGLIQYRALKPIRHGTAAGRNAHKRRGEPVCSACRDAYNRFHRDYQRSMKQREGVA